MLKIGDTFEIQKESKWNECYIGQKVIIDDIDGVGEEASSYLVSDANDKDYFCCLQTVPFEETENVGINNER